MIVKGKELLEVRIIGEESYSPEDSYEKIRCFLSELGSTEMTEYK